MPLSNAEQQRKWREKQRANPETKEAYLRKERQQKKQTHMNMTPKQLQKK